MKIFYPSHALLPSTMSHTLSIMRTCQAFADGGNEVFLSATGPPGEKGVDLFRFYGVRENFRVRTRRFPSWTMHREIKERLHGIALARDCSRFGPDLVYSRICLRELHWLPSDIPVVYEMHGPQEYGQGEHKLRQFKALTRRKNFRRLVVTTEKLRAFLAPRFPHLEVRVVRLSAEAAVNVPEEDLRAFQQSTLQGRGDFRVGFTGCLDDHGLRGGEVICRLAERLGDMEFHVVGGPPETVAFWRGRTAATNIYFYGHRNPSSIPLFLRSFDAVMAPLQHRVSERESLGMGMSPLKIPQYLAYGCAIVASDVDGHLELMDDGVHALIVKADRLDEWARALERLRREPGLRAALRRNAERRYQQVHRPEERVRRILEGLQR